MIDVIEINLKKDEILNIFAHIILVNFWLILDNTKSRDVDRHRGELVGGGIGSGARPPIFDVRRLMSVLETPCVSQSARKRSPIMRIHTTELLLNF